MGTEATDTPLLPPLTRRASLHGSPGGVHVTSPKGGAASSTAQARGLRLRRSIARGLSALRPGVEIPIARVRLASLLGAMMASVFMMLRLFVPSTVGMADTGAGHDLLCRLGLAGERPFDGQLFAGFIHPVWRSAEWFGEACQPSQLVPTFSAHFALVEMARLAGSVFGPVFGTVFGPDFGWGTPNGFDTRIAGILACLVFGTLIGFFVFLLPGRIAFRLALATLITVVVADGVFADFFVSPVSDGTVFLAILASLVAILAFWGWFEVHPFVRLIGVVLAVLALSVAPVMLFFVLPMVLILLRNLRELPAAATRQRQAAASRQRHASHRSQGGRTTFAVGRRAVTSALPIVLAALVLVAVGASQFQFAATRNVDEALYSAVFRVILPQSPDPSSDLQWFGLASADIAASGAAWGSAQADAVVAGQLGLPGALGVEPFGTAVTPTTLALFFLTHPERLVGLSDRGLNALAAPELVNRGSFTLDSGHTAFQKDHRVPVVLGVARLFELVPTLLYAMHLIAFFLGVGLALRKKRSKQVRAVGAALAILLAVSWCIFWASILVEPTQLSQSLLPVALITALALPLAVASALLLASVPSARAQPARTKPRSH